MNRAPKPNAQMPRGSARNDRRNGGRSTVARVLDDAGTIVLARWDLIYLLGVAGRAPVASIPLTRLKITAGRAAGCQCDGST